MALPSPTSPTQVVLGAGSSDSCHRVRRSPFRWENHGKPRRGTTRMGGSSQDLDVRPTWTWFLLISLKHAEDVSMFQIGCCLNHRDRWMNHGSIRCHVCGGFGAKRMQQVASGEPVRKPRCLWPSRKVEYSYDRYGTSAFLIGKQSTQFWANDFQQLC